MKRVMIVDDEFLVRLGLRTTINWAAHGYMIAGEASNGREALDLFDEVNPDILMTDIKMPVMDGLELISEVNKKKKLQVVILSNYDDFTYARKAVQLGASQYILKSEINEKSLLDLLKSLTFESGKEEKVEVSGWQKREEYLRGQLFGLPVNGDISPKSIAVPDKSVFSNPPYVVQRGFCDVSGLSESSSDMLSKTIKSIIDTTLEEPVYCSSFFKGQFYFSVICSVAKLGIDPLLKLKEQSKLLVRNTKHYFDVDLRVGISSAGGCNSFPQMFAQAETERKRCFFTKDSISIFMQDVRLDADTTAFRVSHSKVKSLSDMKDEIDPEMLGKGMRVITGETERLAQMVEELLDFSRLQNGRMQLIKDKLDMIAELSDAVLMFEERAKHEGKRMLYHEPDQIAPFFGDRNRLRQVFVNIIDNALKYSDRGDTITIRASVTGENICISVSDTGCGIKDTDLPKIKQKFFKANSTRRGSGIGLAVADEIVTMHDGTMEITSKENTGTRVSILFPLLQS